MGLARLLPFAAVALSALPAAAPAPDGALAQALVDTAEQACIPALSGQLAWPKAGPDEDALLARLKLQQGVPNDFYEKIKKLDPRLDSLSRAILASRAQTDGAFAMALGGIDNSCRLLVYRTADRTALTGALEAALAAKGWKHVPLAPTPTPKRVFVRRIAGGRVAAAHLVMPASDAPIAPLLVIEMIPAGMPVPPEFGI